MSPTADNPVKLPTVLVMAGLDPTGGAGLQADIEAIASQGAHAAPVATALTVQDTRDVQRLVPVEAELVMEQARAVLEDMPVAAVKLGVMGSVENVEVVHSLLRDYPELPLILDPVLAAGGGRELAEDGLLEALDRLLIPQATIVTPNSRELRRLVPEGDSLPACAMALLDRGAEYVLVTGSHEPTESVENALYGGNRRLEHARWPRLGQAYHGSGCTLSAALAGLMAQGHEPLSATQQAQEYTWNSLHAGYRAGMGQWLPNRLFWAMDPPEEGG